MDYLIKAAIFIPFMGLIYVFVDYFRNILVQSVSNMSFTGILCQFGVFEGLSIFFTILISAFVTRQAIDFIK